MTALFIILGLLGGILLLLILTLLLGVARVRLRYADDRPLRVTVSLFRIPVTVVGRKKKEPKPLRDCKDPEELFDQEEARYLRYLEKKQKKDAKQREKKRLKAAQKAQKKKDKAAKKAAGVPSPNLGENLTMILALIKRFYQVSNGRMQVKVLRVKLSVGTDDAAKTALLYGVAVQTVTCMLEWLDKVYLPIQNREEVAVYPDYLSGKTRADVDIVLSLSLRRVIAMAVKMLLSYRTESKKAKASAHERMQSKKKAPEKLPANAGASASH